MKRSALASVTMGIYADQAQRAVRSVDVLLSEKGRSSLAMMSAMFETMRAMGAAYAKGMEVEEPPASMRRVPKKNFIGPIADGPSSLWFREAMGAEYAWWQEQSRKVPRFGLIVYEACNFADAKRTLAEIEGAVAAEYGELPSGLVEGVFDRLARVGLVEWVETKK